MGPCGAIAAHSFFLRENVPQFAGAAPE